MRPDPTGRRSALAALLVLGAAVAVVVAVTTPWDPLGVDVPGGRAPVGPDGDFTAAEVARADAYRGAVRPPSWLSLGAGLLTALVLGLTPLGGRLVAAAARPLGGGRRARLLAGGAGVVVVTRLASLPFDARAEQVAMRAGLSTRDWPGWLLDVGRGLALDLVLLLLALGALQAMARRWPRRWWAPAAGAGAALVVAVSFAYPLVVEPLYNRFTPLPEGRLRSDLLALAERDGVPVADVLVADASRRTSTLNAYVSGFGATKRIVVYDTLLERAPPEQVESVVAHELGHAEEQDVLHGTLVGALGVAAGVCALALALGSPRLLRRAGASGAGDPRSTALALAVVAVLTTAAGPVQLLVSRQVEERADLHALELTRDPLSLAELQRRLALTSRSDLTPHPLVEALFASHPSAPERIARARDWARATTLPGRGPAVPPPGPLAPGG
ncbi:M48 family metalloprotease [Vallicoccus soli]|uniref:M48 family peptidase n=1 Tax=Vallicoccus soli TaxID=2339232 RepID=A0A3A3ZLQ1_9ACTN|nr:M48 family metalloprotease [Vallicoccus soli]RJK97206.1 M48 family peptidase [Vallicoccus soli]